jgi:hypothetical protein
MTKLTDTQRIILSAASQRTDRLALPLPKSIKGGAALKVINPLIQRGLLEEVAANRKLGDPVWRATDEGHGVTLIITDAGLEAIGVEPVTPDRTSESVRPAKPPKTRGAPRAATGGEDAHEAAAMPDKTSGPAAPAAPEQGRKTREGTKQALIIAMLGRPEGASITEIAEASGWLHHTIRGMIAGSLRKKLGLAITSTKGDGRGRIYRLD